MISSNSNSSEKIKLSEHELIEKLVKNILQSFSSNSLIILRRENLLKPLVDKLYINLICQNEDINISKKDLEKETKKYFIQKNLINQNYLEKHLDSINITKKDLGYFIETPLKIEKISLDLFSQKAKAQFINRKEKLDKYIYSLIRVKDSDTAHELYFRIDSGESDFYKLSKDFSFGVEKLSGGIIGPTSLSNVHPKLKEILRATNPKDLIEPFQIENWWVVARLEERISARYDEEVKILMAKELFFAYVNSQTNKVIKILLKGLNNDLK